MTAGEFARYFNGELLPAAGKTKVADLDVIMVQGWRTDVLYADTGLPWILPSPNMPTPDRPRCSTRAPACSRRPTSPRAAAPPSRSS